MKKYFVIAGVLLTAILLMATVYNANLLPATTGLDLGSPTQQWDAFLQNVTIYGTLTTTSPQTFSAITVTGASSLNTATFSGAVTHTGAVTNNGLVTNNALLTLNSHLNFATNWTVDADTGNLLVTNQGSSVDRLRIFQLAYGNSTDVSAEGSGGVVTLNNAPGSGTGGVEFWSGSNSPAKVGSVNGSGLGTFNGGIKAGASGSTISDTRALVQAVYNCGTTSTCSNTANQSEWIVRGTVALSSASPSAVTVASISPAYTSTATYSCTATPEGNTAAIAAGGIAITKVSGSSFTLTGPNTVTTVIDYTCIGH